jgi:hypothetical protein
MPGHARQTGKPDVVQHRLSKQNGCAMPAKPSDMFPRMSTETVIPEGNRQQVKTMPISEHELTDETGRRHEFHK